MRFTSSKGRGTSSAHAGGSRRTGPAVGIPRFLKTAPRIAPASAERQPTVTPPYRLPGPGVLSFGCYHGGDRFRRGR